MATCAVEKPTEESVVHQLNELFGNVLHLDVIRRVAVSCHYDVTESSNKLLEITSFSDELAKEKKIKPLTPVSDIRSPIPVKSQKALDIERVISITQKGYKILILMRGLPGSGKSHLSKHILHSAIGLDASPKQHILSTDDFFYENGVYKYNIEKISKAHGWNHNRAFHALSRGFSPVIIDNTNLQMWEMKPYAMMATDYGYFIEILEPDTHWCFHDKELAKRNLHGVSKSKIKDMLDRYDPNITPLKLLNAYNLTYRLQKPPQWRLYPPLNTNNSLGSKYLEKNTSVIGKCNYERSNGIRSENALVFNHNNVVKSKSKPVETIDLMEFTDDENTASGTLQPVIEIVEDEISIMSWNTNPVNNVLNCNNNKAVDLLRPIQNSIDEILISDDSSDEDIVKGNMEKKLFPDLETAWGINENALRSWDIVTPVNDEGGILNLRQFRQQRIRGQSVATKESSSNTDEKYFQMLKRNSFYSISANSKIVTTLNRDINRSTPKKAPYVPKKSVLDKSCLTEDIFENYDNHMSQLINLFPSVPKSHLKYWYNKCKGDLEWTIEFLLEAKEEITTLIEKDVEKMEDNGSEKQGNNKILPTNSDSSDTNPGIVNEQESKSKRIRKMSDEHKEIKKIIESKIDISHEHYSKHLLKVKQFRFGSNGNNSNKTELPVSNKSPLSITPDAKHSKPTTSNNECYILTDDESDIEFDEFEEQDIADKTERKPEETTELNLGDSFAAQLEEKFGDPNMIYPKGFQPVVQVPITLARQLYTFYIESVYQQMENQKQVLETLIKEDEDFARKLQAKEEEKMSAQVKASSLQEIMDEQVAQNIYQKEAEKWKDLDPDNLAARLTKQKLFKIFPDIDKNALVEILYAHDNKYQDTVDILLASTGVDKNRSIDYIREPPLKEEIIQEMKEAQESNCNKEYDDQHEATFYREEATKYLKKRAELYQKAQQYHQRGMTEVAQFYSGLASQQTIYYDRANNLAATAFLDEHSKRLQDFNTIDLHFLYVKEAVPALDVFLDRNINLLRLSTSKQSEYLQIITGRGKRSENGISKIRPAVMSQLRRRKIKFVQLNPGLLKVKVTKNSLVTSEL